MTASLFPTCPESMLIGLHSSNGPGARDDELNVMDLLSRVRIWSVGSDGKMTWAIAAWLGIDERSAERSVERIRLRLGFQSVAQIVARYAACGEREELAISGSLFHA